VSDPCYTTDYEGTPPFIEFVPGDGIHVFRDGADITGFLPGGEFVDLLYPDYPVDIPLTARAVPDPVPTNMVITWRPTQDTNEFDLFGVPTHGTAGVGAVSIVTWPAIVDPTGDTGGYPLTAHRPSVIATAHSGIGSYPLYTATIAIPNSVAYWYMFTFASDESANPVTGTGILHIDFYCDTNLGAPCYGSVGFRAFGAIALGTAIPSRGRRSTAIMIN
jgi:hypothetical protein